MPPIPALGQFQGGPDVEATLASRKPIHSKPQLVAALQEAAEIEHQLMIQYLYAAFSLKKRPDERCTPAQYEFVRRWGSTLLMVARQEMEHLALVNGLLSAFGAAPWFSRENIPRQSRYFLGANMAAFKAPGGEVTPCDIPFVFERFNLATIGRFVCMESPGYDTLKASGDPIPSWCFGTPEHPCPGVDASAGPKAVARYPPSRSHLAAASLAAPASAPTPAAGPGGAPAAAAAAESALAAPGESTTAAAVGADSIAPGTIQELYDEIGSAIHKLPAGELFTGNPSRQVFVPVEYQINIFPITDVASADTAIELIVEEGEGIDAPPGYQSHFRRFFDVHCELSELLRSDPKFAPSLPLPFNPKPRNIVNPVALELCEIFNYTYVTLLFLLTSLYRNFQPAASQTSYPYLSLALQEAAFGPMMTMLVRPLAEALAYIRSGDGTHTTGPNYRLSKDDDRLLTAPASRSRQLDDIDFFLDRFGVIVDRLEGLLRDGDGHGHGNLAAAARGRADLPFLERQLQFVYESATAIRNNLRRIYQIGELPQFIVAP
jgi:hypothetical protein